MLKWKLLAALGLASGFAGVTWGFAQPSEPGFYELRIYTTLPGQRDALAARFGDYTTKIYERHGIRNVGYWLAASGENADRTFVYMRGYGIVKLTEIGVIDPQDIVVDLIRGPTCWVSESA